MQRRSVSFAGQQTAQPTEQNRLQFKSQTDVTNCHKVLLTVQPRFRLKFSEAGSVVAPGQTETAIQPLARRTENRNPAGQQKQ